MAEPRTRIKVEEAEDLVDTEIKAIVEGDAETPEVTETETPAPDAEISIDPEDTEKEAEEEPFDPGMVLVVVPKEYMHRDNKTHATTTFKAGTYRMLKSIATDWWSVNNGVTLVEEE